MDYIEYLDLISEAEDTSDSDAEPKQKIYRSWHFPLYSLDDAKLIDEYRFPRRIIEEIAEELRPKLKHKSKRSMALSAELQTMIGLKFLATGDHFKTIKDVFHVSEASVCRSVNQVIDALYSLRKKYVVFPSTLKQYVQNAGEFAEIAGFPGIIGCVDGTHVGTKNRNIRKSGSD